MVTNEATAAGVRLVLVGVRARRARLDDRACGDDAAALAHYHSPAAGAPHHHCGAAAADAARGWSLGKDRLARLEMGTDPISIGGDRGRPDYATVSSALYRGSGHRFPASHNFIVSVSVQRMFLIC